MKGQLTIQYLASFIFFIGLVVYIYFSFSANIPAFVEEVGKEDIRSKAYQLSEVLVNDPGEPANWQYVNPDDIRRIGLSDENSNKTNLISLQKVYQLDDPIICGLAPLKLALLRPFSILIFNISQTTGERNPLAECTPFTFPTTAINVTVKRITALNNTETGKLELAEIIVQM
jgi:hypothetical protein